MDSGLISFIPVHYIYWVCGAMLTILVSVISLAAKQIWGNISKSNAKIDTIGNTMEDIGRELTLQRTNCLATLQRQGERQVELLSHIAESVSYLKGKNDQ